MVGVSIVGNIFSEHEVERVMESNAHGTLSVVVIDGNGIEGLKVQEVLSMKRHVDHASDRQPHLVPFDGRSDIRRMIMEHNGNEI